MASLPDKPEQENHLAVKLGFSEVLHTLSDGEEAQGKSYHSLQIPERWL